MVVNRQLLNLSDLKQQMHAIYPYSSAIPLIHTVLILRPRLIEQPLSETLLVIVAVGKGALVNLGLELNVLGRSSHMVNPIIFPFSFKGRDRHIATSLFYSLSSLNSLG